VIPVRHGAGCPCQRYLSVARYVARGGPRPPGRQRSLTPAVW